MKHDHPGGGGRRNDPNWEVHVADSPKLVAAQGTVPHVGVGGYRCNCCDRPLIALSVSDPEAGAQIDTLVDPKTAIAIVQSLVRKLADVGESLVALQALRTMTVVSQLASMTDTECDFLDGSDLRQQCRAVLDGKAATFPRMYDSADEQRAIDALRAAVMAPHKPLVLSGTILANRDDLRRAVRTVAEALGMKPAF